MFKKGDLVRIKRSGWWADMADDDWIKPGTLGYITNTWRNMYEVTLLNGKVLQIGTLEVHHYMEKVDAEG